MLKTRLLPGMYADKRVIKAHDDGHKVAVPPSRPDLRRRHQRHKRDRDGEPQPPPNLPYSGIHVIFLTNNT